MVENRKDVDGDKRDEFRRGDVFGEEDTGLLDALHESIERVGIRGVEGLVQISLLLHDLDQLLSALNRRAYGETCGGGGEENEEKRR